MIDLPFLLNNEVHVWIIDINSEKQNLDVYKKKISKDEILKSSKFRFKKDRNCSIIARGSLRLLSSKYLNIKPECIKFEYGEHKKPYYDFETNLKFNVSHSGDIVIVSFVKDFHIGADIEIIKNNFDVLDIASNFFSELEIEALKKVHKEKQAEYFYRCWTRKESFIKAKAKGLSFPLDSFSVSIDSDEKTELLETKWDKNEKELWKLFSFSPKENYLGAISVKGNIQNIKYFNFNEFI